MALPGILQQLAQSNPMLQNIKQMMGMINASQNPQLVMNQLLSGNPHLKQVMDTVNQLGGDPKTAFYKLAEQKGVDPNEILNMLK